MEFILDIGSYFVTVMQYIGIFMNCTISEFLSGLSGVPIGEFISPFNDTLIYVYNWIPFSAIDGWLGVDFFSMLGIVSNWLGHIIATALTTFIPFVADVPMYLFMLVFGVVIIIPYSIWNIIVG